MPCYRTRVLKIDNMRLTAEIVAIVAIWKVPIAVGRGIPSGPDTIRDCTLPSLILTGSGRSFISVVIVLRQVASATEQPWESLMITAVLHWY